MSPLQCFKEVVKPVEQKAKIGDNAFGDMVKGTIQPLRAISSPRKAGQVFEPWAAPDADLRPHTAHQDMMRHEHVSGSVTP